MIEIKDLISKLGDKFFSSEIKKETIRKIISNEIGLDINASDFEIKNGTIYLNIEPIYKNEFLLKKEKIFERLERELGGKIPDNFR